MDIENLPVEFVTDEGNQYFIIPETAQTPPVYQTPRPVRQIRPQVDETHPQASQSRIPVRHTPRPVNIKNMKWKKGSLIFDENTRPHTNLLPDNISQLFTPLQFFSLFFTDELYTNIQKEIKLFSVQKNPNKPIHVTIPYTIFLYCIMLLYSYILKRYVGICVYSSVIQVPKVRDNWSTHLGFVPIYNALRQKRFEAIRAALHFNYNDDMLPRSDPNYDRLFKLRPLVSYLNNQFGKIPYSRDLSLDEQMCSTKARNILKQYMPNKPNKWGYKLFVLCDYKGYSYNLEVYTGQENNPKFNDVDIGASGNVVISLIKNVPNNRNYRLYFDNYYTSVPLINFQMKNK